MLSCGLQAKLSPKEHWLVALVVANLSWLPMHLENRDAVPDGACTDARLNQAASVAAGLDPPITPARMVTPELNEGYARGVRWTILAALVKVLERTIAQLEQMIRDGQGDIAAARAALITARDLLAASLIVRAAGAAASAGAKHQRKHVGEWHGHESGRAQGVLGRASESSRQSERRTLSVERARERASERPTR